MKQINRLFSFLLMLLCQQAAAQSTFTEWNFNSNPPDVSNSTGSTLPSVGTGTFTLIGGLTQAFSSGSANGGSSDPAITDNTGLQTSAFAAQGTNNKTCGIQFRVSTVG